jgi:hypothetical protein
VCQDFGEAGQQRHEAVIRDRISRRNEQSPQRRGLTEREEKGRVTERGVRLVRGVDRREGEPFVPPSTAHGNAADGDRLEVRPETREPLGIRVTQNAGVVAGQVCCRKFGNRKVSGQTPC